MNTRQPHEGNKALVAVFDDLATAQHVVERLHAAGFSLQQIELVTHDLDLESPEIETPRDHETQLSSVVDGMTKGLKIGLTAGTGAGLVGAVITGFPGLILGEMILGSLIGTAYGGIAGGEHAATDDSVDLPTREEYQQLLEQGDSLVVVLCDHDEAMRAEEIVKQMRHVKSHIHMVHGHEFHEHPAREGN